MSDAAENRKLTKEDKKWIWLAAKAAAVIFIIIYAFIFVFAFHVYHGDSMYPNLKDGELCLIYKVKNISRKDVVYYSEGSQKGFSRVAASAGDIISAKGGRLYVNGEPSNDYEKVNGNIKRHRVKKGCVYLISDSADASELGDVPLGDIQGKVIASMQVREF